MQANQSKKLQANDILECLHRELGNMIHTSMLEVKNDLNPADVLGCLLHPT